MALRSRLNICVMMLMLYLPTSMAHTSKVQTPDALAKTYQYYDSGQYFNDISQKITEAKEYLEEHLKQPTAKLAIVLDVDETALSNYHNLKRIHFSGNAEAYTGAYMLGDLPPIESVLELYQYALDNQVAVFFISNRPNTPEIHSATVMNLKRAGYHSWDGVYLRPLTNDKISIERFKSQARKSIIDKGFNIVLNIGDQPSDINGGYAKAHIKLPNPFYNTTS